MARANRFRAFHLYRGASRVRNSFASGFFDPGISALPSSCRFHFRSAPSGRPAAGRVGQAGAGQRGERARGGGGVQMRLDKNSLVKEALGLDPRSKTVLRRCESWWRGAPPPGRQISGVDIVSERKTKFRMENASGRDNESPSIPIACAYNEPVTRSRITLGRRGGEEERTRGREGRERKREADINFYPTYTLRSLVASTPTNGGVHTLLSAFPWHAAGFHLHASERSFAVPREM